MKFINFDKAATTPLHPAAERAFLQACQGNPASAHALGREAKAELEQARQTIAHCLNCEPDEVYFTSGATESCNWMMYCLSTTGRKVYPFSNVHHAVSEYPVPHARGNEGVSSGNVAASLVNNETGQVCRISPLRAVCGGLLGLDATAAVGHIPVDFKALGADYMAFGGHKFGTPKGIGALIVRRGAPIRPMVYGGAQERGMRGGTVSVPLACAMAAALEWHTAHMEENITHLIDLWDRLLHRLTESGVAYRVNGGKNTAAHILSLTFPGVYGASLAAALSDHGVMVSTGSACSSGENRASQNLMASGLTEQEALETVRFSFDWQNTTDEVDEAAQLIADLVPHLKHEKEMQI